MLYNKDFTGIPADQEDWRSCKKILVIRTDHMGDIIMSSPAIRALKIYTNAAITVLASPQGAACIPLIPEVSATIIADFPWNNPHTSLTGAELAALTENIRLQEFDGCVIFTVYSQNPLPAAMVAWSAGIPKRLAYCRENPYQLLTKWIPDQEPYRQLKHQVSRDLDLIKAIGWSTNTTHSTLKNGKAFDDQIRLSIPETIRHRLRKKLQSICGLSGKNGTIRPYIIFHPEASESRRSFDDEKWVKLGKRVKADWGLPIFLTGASADMPLIQLLHTKTGKDTYNMAGQLDMLEFAALIQEAVMLVSVNTGAIHIAAGLQVPVIALYARTNPQHCPWKTDGTIFEYDIPDHIKSRNEVVKYVDSFFYKNSRPKPSIANIIAAMKPFILPHLDPGMRISRIAPAASS